MKNKNTTYRFRFKWVLRYDPYEGKFRIFRILWSSGLDAMRKGWYSAKLSLSLDRRLFYFERNLFNWQITFFGIRLHQNKSFGSWEV